MKVEKTKQDGEMHDLRGVIKELQNDIQTLHSVVPGEPGNEAILSPGPLERSLVPRCTRGSGHETTPT